MSIFSNLNVSVNALQAHGSKISSISQNISNVSTVGYKQNLPVFEEMVSLASGVLSTLSGAEVRNRSNVGKQGEILRTDLPTDLAISGNGFFAVRTDSAGATDTYYTRAGHFAPNSDGDFVNMAGYFLQGWRLDGLGNLPAALSTGTVAAATATGALETINVELIDGTNVPTSNVSLQANLKSSQALVAGTYNAADPLHNMASGVVQPQFSRNVEVIDSTGVKRNLTIGFVKTALNEWTVEMYGNPASSTGTTNPQVATGTINFNGDGTLNSVSPSISQVSVNWLNAPATNQISFAWGTAGDMFGTPGSVLIGRADGMTQFDSDFNVARVVQNGSRQGTLETVSVDKFGNLTATYDNGTSKKLYKIPLVDFADSNQLETKTGDIFSQKGNTSAAIYGQPGSQMFGQIQSQALEQSNVDLSDQFSELIIAQRAYQSNTKAITTSDEMLQSLTGMLR